MKKQWLLFGVVIGAVAMGGLLPIVKSSPEFEDVRFGTITAKEIILVDRKTGVAGTADLVRARLGMTNTGAFLHFYGPFDSDGERPETILRNRSLAFLGDRNLFLRPRGLKLTEGLKDSVSLERFPNREVFLSLFDMDGNERARLSVAAEDALVPGHPRLLLFDKEGNMIWKAPEKEPAGGPGEVKEAIN